MLQLKNVTQRKFQFLFVGVTTPPSSGLWECGNPAFCAGFPSAEGRVKNSFGEFSTLSSARHFHSPAADFFSARINRAGYREAERRRLVVVGGVRRFRWG